MALDEQRDPTELPNPNAWAPPDLDDLSRILALSDGVFAFAMTLLVLNLTGLSLLNCGSAALPCSESVLARGLADSVPVFIGYGIVFFVVALWWTTHHRIFRFIERYDTMLVWFNIFLLICIGATPFALEVFNRFSGTTLGVVVFASVTGVTGLLLAAIWWHALGPAQLVNPAFPESERRAARARSIVTPFVFLATVPIAFVAPSIAPYLWLIAFPAGAIMRHYGPA